MIRKAFLLFMFLLTSNIVVILTPTRSFSAEDARVYVDPPVIADPSVNFNVSIRVENVENLAGAEWKLTWDPALLKVVKMREVLFHEITPQTEWDNIWQIIHEVDNVLGVAYYAYTFVDASRATEGGYRPIAGNHTMALLTFQVAGVGNCSLHVALSKLGASDGSSIIHDRTDGFFSNSVPPPPLPPGPIEDSQLLFYIDPRRIRDESLIPNSTFSVAVRMDSIAVHRGVVDFAFAFEWNSTLLEFVDVTEVMFHEVTPENESDNIETTMYVDDSTGQLEYHALFANYTQAVAEGYLPVFGNHTVAVVTFRVKNFGKCQLHLPYFRASDVLDMTIFYTCFDGYFGNMMNGDVNGDNVVDLFDAIAFAKSYGLSLGLSGWDEEADINGDGRADIFDAVQLARFFGHTR